MANDLPTAKATIENKNLLREIRKLRGTWVDIAKNDSKELAQLFVNDINRFTRKQMNQILESAGIDIITPEYSTAIKKAAQKSARENVELIRTLPKEYFNRIEMDIVHGIERGISQRDIYEYAIKAYGERTKQTEYRAKLIAQNQTARVYGAINRARAEEVGVTEGVWMHASAAREPRPGHVKANGKRFDLRKGLKVDNASKGAKKRDIRYTFPGDEPNCGCEFRIYLEGVTIE